MKTLLKTQYMLAKKNLYIFIPVSMLLCLVFSLINPQPIMSGFMCCYLLSTIALDNIKNETGSDWIKFALTMPVNRKMYVKSHFVFYTILTAIGGLITLIITSIVFQSVLSGLIALLIGLGLTVQLTVMYPLNYKYGSENSNAIQLLALFPSIVIFVIFIIILSILGIDSHGNMNKGIYLVGCTLYFVISLGVALVNYTIALKIFKSLNF
ncbi:ABC-2 transporter permease [Staphylococcus sp. SQ8-PEA]|uniref:ABC-2 transporter permease n=1 Tax=Staphylococcus marylandisciuri TaxID=2981529 RepID=A0ABT2QMZ3_9STAP|nr:ABC-2 transporter permease [Staphylococcus marylandisciuri]MCU5745331.1 ABC-2 transporter permease [Staphylococcus marylandisciuri]